MTEAARSKRKMIMNHADGLKDMEVRTISLVKWPIIEGDDIEAIVQVLRDGPLVFAETATMWAASWLAGSCTDVKWRTRSAWVSPSEVAITACSGGKSLCVYSILRLQCELL